MIIVSSCLLGLACRYDGKAKSYGAIEAYLKDKNILAVCPEQMGGLSTPRKPCEIISSEPLLIQSIDGEDCTSQFLKGIAEIDKLLLNQEIDCAILKSRSPSCGSKEVYDGTFSRMLVKGQGIFAASLMAKNVEVLTELDFIEE